MAVPKAKTLTERLEFNDPELTTHEHDKAQRILLEASVELLTSTYIQLIRDVEDSPFVEEVERTAMCVELRDGRLAQVMVKITTDQSKWLCPMSEMTAAEFTQKNEDLQ